MFREQPKLIDDLLTLALRQLGLETPLNEHRLIDSWGKVVGPIVEKYTKNLFIKNQALYVQITSAAIKNELLMKRSQLVMELNNAVQAQVITKIFLI